MSLKMQSHHVIITTLFAGLASLGFLASVFFGIDIPMVLAKNSPPGQDSFLYGFAWNNNYGWISFNSDDCDVNGNGTFADDSLSGCPTSGTVIDYKVKLNDNSGNLSGQAWSERLGWISFDQADTYPCPDGGSPSTCTPRVDKDDGNKLKGWARIVSMEQVAYTGKSHKHTKTLVTDDGWISLSGTSTNNMPYGVVYDPSNENLPLLGYAWGGDIGWIKFASISDPLSLPQYNVYKTNISPLAVIVSPSSGNQLSPVSLKGALNDPDGNDFAKYEWIDGTCPAGVFTGAFTGTLLVAAEKALPQGSCGPECFGADPVTSTVVIDKPLSVGSHTISFAVQDGRGAWSTCASTSVTIIPPQCNDGINNDPSQDFYIDSVDPGCYSGYSTSTGDIVYDPLGNPISTGTYESSRNSELQPQCSDFIDNMPIKGGKKNGLIDKSDPACYDNFSTSTGKYIPSNFEDECGNGYCGTGESFGNCPVDCRANFKFFEF